MVVVDGAAAPLVALDSEAATFRKIAQLRGGKGHVR